MRAQVHKNSSNTSNLRVQLG